MSDQTTAPAELDAGAEPITLLVRAAERGQIARRLLEFAPDPRLVASTSEGFVVPRWLAQDADMILAEPATPPPAGLTAGEVYAAELDAELDALPPVDDAAPGGQSEPRPAAPPVKAGKNKKGKGA